MATYEVKVKVDFSYEVEADSPEQAEEQGWLWEDYTHFSEVYSIHVDEIEPDGLDEDEDE
jgi:hypothetical protein